MTAFSKATARLALALLAGWYGSLCMANSIVMGGSGYPVYPAIADTGDARATEHIRRGEYLVKLGDCLACHTDSDTGGAAFAGGLRIDTPFGALYTPNITPDKATGIGNWSEEDFVRAMRRGIRPDGSYYFPVFPYNYFSKFSRDEVLAIKAYLDSIPAVARDNKAQQLHWPFNYRFLQWGWRLLYFDFDENAYRERDDRSRTWNRGAFIVEGPGHCALCHTELNLLGVPKQKYYLAGAFVEEYYAPDITARGLQNLNTPQVAAIFAQDRTPQDTPLSGPMADVEHNSLRYLTGADALAVAEYLRSVNSDAPPVEPVKAADLGAEAGQRLYDSNCKLCHAISAVGAPQLDNASTWLNLLDQGRERLYDIALHGDGVMPPRGGCSACSDARIKAAVDYMIDTALHESRPGTDKGAPDE